MDITRTYKKYDDRKVKCEWCGYDGCLTMAHYERGKFIGGVRIICKCVNGTVEIEKSPCLLQSPDILEWGDAIDLADGVGYVIVKCDEEYPKYTRKKEMVEHDDIPF
jgi:hypothetical protein